MVTVATKRELHHARAARDILSTVHGPARGPGPDPDPIVSLLACESLSTQCEPHYARMVRACQWALSES